MADDRRAANKKRTHYQRMQALFVEAWHRTNPALSKSERARQAAIEAGYAPESAHAAGSKLLSKPHILEQILTSNVRTLVHKSAVDSVWLLNELAELWEMPLAALFDENGRLLDLDQMPHGAQKLIAGFDIVEDTVVHKGRRTVTTRLAKVKLIDRLSVLDKIAKNNLVGAYTTTEERDAQKSLARLYRALEKQVVDPASTARDVTPPEPRITEGDKPRSLVDVINAQDE